MISDVTRNEAAGKEERKTPGESGEKSSSVGNSEDAGTAGCVPILCCLQGGEKCVPAVKVTAATGKVCILPLSREELGQVWEGGEAMWPWIERRAEPDWEKGT